MTTKIKIPSGRELNLADEIKTRPSGHRPTKADLNEEFKLEEILGFPAAKLGETLDERAGNLARIMLRRVKAGKTK